MNNDQFRALLRTSDTPQSASSGTPRTRPGATPAAASLGSRLRSSIPMTPRTVRGSGGVDFARQLAEQRAGSSQPATKKFRSSAAPKGTRLAAGYTDRAAAREDDEADDRAQRVNALEESMKLGQIDQATFEALRDQITGGDIGATHLVKGLDRRLLERARRGEDVWKSGSGGGDKESAQKEPSPDVDEEFDKLEEKEIAPVVHEKREKKGEVAAMPPPVAGAKRSRNAILAELKAQRKAAAEAKAAAQPQLGNRFKRIGEQKEVFPRIERDERGREVLITKDEDGNIKRKVRKIKAGAEGEAAALLMPDKDAKPLGADVEVPDLPPAPAEEDEDDDIFEGVGDSYDPLAGIGSDSSESDEEGEEGEVEPSAVPKSPPSKPTSPTSAEAEVSPESAAAAAADAMPPPPQPTTAQPATTTVPKTNYFNEPSSKTTEQPSPPLNPLQDATILAAIRKARDIKPDTPSSAAASAEEAARQKRRAEMLASADRDFEDMDMGFGESRFGDAEDMEEGGAKVKLSEWKGVGADGGEEDEGREGRGGQKRKRGPKKRKGDKESVGDVLRVVEQRRGGGAK
ncbi:uncharacterized protein K452DRAFT_314565 [Aplosporella prunicola CBS 121167]|uniref:RED-like N-terminal domain-containing protein n=1 Tax=Aplosporella prunicola CBS 121167 TaxID=1176127 RepID=A0A6A6BVN2_9PEZI|nr:uncharacterized protein K452DRAFT_314565 [Aplosporella prunicola CBS 121167]KAF2147403.1 hypothetical protein K452DRAFT_314565 [Aplosporella prunicola CBS 121167]